VFYRGQRAMITQHVFETVHVGRIRFAIKQMMAVYIVRHDSAGRPVLGMSALAAALLVVPVVGPASVVLAVLTCGVLLIGAVITVRRRDPVRWELVAIYDGRPVTLFESRNQSEFDQVCRGLQRAMERNGDAG